MGFPSILHHRSYSSLWICRQQNKNKSRCLHKKISHEKMSLVVPLDEGCHPSNRFPDVLLGVGITDPNKALSVCAK